MTCTVLDVGNCAPDHNAIRTMLTREFNANVLQADRLDDSLKVLQENEVQLILVNRKLDIDYSDGIDIIKHLQSLDPFRDIPMMLVTNYEEHQQDAIAVGAVRGFGKLEINSVETRQRLADVLQQIG